MKTRILALLLAATCCAQGNAQTTPDPSSRIYWTEYATDTVRRTTVDGSVVEIIVDTGLFSPQSMAIDPVNSKMYWTDSSPGEIEMANLDGTGRQTIVTGLTYPTGLTVDQVDGKIYWTDAVDWAGGGKIQRANLDGTGVEDVISTGLLGPDGVAVDATGGKLYWTDEIAGTVQRANLDGSNVEVLAISRIPVGIALDRLNSKLYWSEYPLCCTFSAQIVRANLDGTGKEVVYISPRQTNMEQIALDVGIQGKVFWADDFNQTVSSVNLDGTGFEDVVSGAGAAWGVAAHIVGDGDSDGIFDHLDNAPNDPNPDQSDIDGDGIADVIDPCPSDPTNGCDPTGSAAESIGSDGGTLATEDGDAEIQFPTGALDDDTSMSITDSGTGFVLNSSIGQAEAIFGVDIGPEGTVFNVPIIIVFSWEDADDNGQVDGTNLQENKLVITKDGMAISDQCQFDAGCDTIANTFTFSVSSLSEFTLSGPLDTDGDGIADDFAGEVDVCPSENATGFDVDRNGCIDSFSGLAELVSNLVIEGIIDAQMQNSLLSKVNNAEASSSLENVCTAVNELAAFDRQVAAQAGKKISAEAAALVTDYSNSVSSYLQSQLAPGESC